MPPTRVDTPRHAAPSRSRTTAAAPRDARPTAPSPTRDLTVVHEPRPRPDVGAVPLGAAIRALGYVRPPRAIGVRLANQLGRGLESADPKRRRFDLEELQAKAIARTGLDDFGSTEHLDPLAVLLRSLEADAELTPLGRHFSRGQVITSLSNRLLLQRAWTADPAILDRELPSPVIVIGLPRTGSTLLQHLLASDPDNRVLLGWEAGSPVPRPGQVPIDGEDPRLRASRRGMKLLDYLAPEARNLHPVGAEMPTECVTLFNNSFASLEIATIHWVPRYLDHVLALDMAPHYAYFKRQLQVLQGDGPARWALKSPAHLFWVDDLLATFPDARVVQTHRDPLQVLGSFCSLSSVFCGIGSDRVDPLAIGRRWSVAWAEGLERAAAARARHPEGRFIDVYYRDLLADPIAAVGALYDAAGLELTRTAEAAMARYVAEHPQHAGGVHRYSLEQFGLDPAVETARFAPYCDAFGV